MNVAGSEIAITVILPEATVAQLVKSLFPQSSDLITSPRTMRQPEATPEQKTAFRDSGQYVQPAGSQKYQCELLGTIVTGATLPEVFASVVDLTYDLDPAVLEKLSEMRPSSARNYISRDKTKVHFRSPYLKTLCTKSGWWISGNISQSQLISALNKLCNVAGLEYGKDLRFL